MLGRQLNNALRPLNAQLIPGTSPDPAIRTFIPARKTIAEARRAGLPVGSYIDKIHAVPGATPEAVQAMIGLGGLDEKCDAVCEIGPGSGRYAEEVINALHPSTYEVYETARDWLLTLRKLPNVVVRDCDGRTLRQTRDASVGLVHAHKVFVYLEFYVVAGYLQEMARVVRPGGTVAFDITSEPCLDDPTVEAWARHGSLYRPVPREWAIGFMRRRGLTLRGSHYTSLPPGKSELLVFRRD
jgi:SAM-dependent methyltransferase